MSEGGGDGLGWLTRRQRDGGIDRIPLPGGVPGALWLCGKHAIAPDYSAVFADVGATATVVCLTEAHELSDRYPRYVEFLRAEQGRGALWWPIPDLHAPRLDEAVAIVGELVERLRRGEVLVMHCAAGVGRTGTIAVCVLVALGLPLDEALAHVAAHRPSAGPEVGAQRELVERFAADTAL